MAGTQRIRVRWEDRFRTPSPAELRGEVGRNGHAAVELAATILLSGEGVRESVQWRGVWNWTIAYCHNGDVEPARAYIIPDPSKPRLCIPFPDEMIEGLPAKKLSREVREALSLAASVNGVRWPVWDIHSKAQVEDVLALLEHKVPAAKPGG
jgi:hypothetical protein